MTYRTRPGFGKRASSDEAIAVVGNVSMASPSRVVSAMTLEEFLGIPEEEPSLEFIDGRIEKVSPQKKHGLIAYRLTDRLNRHAEPAGLGLALPELRCTFAGRSIVPDVVFLLQVHLATDERGELIDETTIPPDLHIEIVSPDRSPRKSRDELVHSTANGCPLGWLIDPEKKTVEVFRAGGPPRLLAADEALEGDPVLPGFHIPVAEVFGWLKWRPPLPNPPSEPGADRV
jgi:Uma2 family endonuclease